MNTEVEYQEKSRVALLRTALGIVESSGADHFTEWFGSSVARDECGLPLVVYRGEHGSPDYIFQSKIGSMSFGSVEAANIYATHPNDLSMIAIAPRVLPVYLKIENPIINSPDDPFIDLSILDRKLGFSEATRIALKFADHIMNTDCWNEISGETGMHSIDELVARAPDRLLELYFNAYILLDDIDEVEKLRKCGFDGAIHMGNGETFDQVEYKVFSLDQVRSVYESGPRLRSVAQNAEAPNNRTKVPLAA